MTDQRGLGGLRIGEALFPVRGLRLEHGTFVVRAVLAGPVDLPTDQMVMLYDPDGELVLRGHLEVAMRCDASESIVFDWRLALGINGEDRRSTTAIEADVVAALAEGADPAADVGGPGA